VQSGLFSTDLQTMGDVENLILLGNGSNGTGNALANVITGLAITSLLLEGNDTLSGGNGNDTQWRR
jgi:hypothetical protein